jgi:hypothetical protein
VPAKVPQSVWKPGRLQDLAVFFSGFGGFSAGTVLFDFGTVVTAFALFPAAPASVF